MFTRGSSDPADAVTHHRSRTLDAREHTALLLEVARRYHVKGQSQAEIARDVAFSRATVSRMLSEARRRGIVQVRIGHPMERVLGIERALVKEYGLKQARVADPEHLSAVREEVAQCAADLLIEVAAEHVVLSISNGLAVAATVDAMPQLVWPRSKVVQMIGSVGQSEGLLDSPETSRRMARKMGGTFHPLPTPLVVSDATVARALRGDNQIATTLELGARADIALVGVGAVTDGRSGLILQEYEDQESAQFLRKSGAVAHICGHHIGASGQHIRTQFCDRTLAVDPERLREVPLVVGVAWGQSKVDPLAAVIQGGFISALVTDRATALSLLDRAEG
ncbi:MAG: sugar-binding domain-containing protein [Propionibacteriaceae bacterium]|nr:sugar-binding protein [Micropruina sp.]HBX82255.1 sugar-binding protein [Propionibacteriaceae bacterium]HBY22460.1 sugar-binding protein [Propionibacteriaceae bacterium]